MLPIPGARIPHTGAACWCASRSSGARLHAGIDLAAPVGDRVLAPESGRVAVVAHASTPSARTRFSRPSGWSGYGPSVVVIQGDSGAWHVLGHVDAPTVVPGERVREGALVAFVGETSTPHLHWEVRSRLQPPRDAAVVEITADPAQWLASGGAWYGYDGRCPTAPADDARTPRACRPSWRGAPPDPFPRPVPREHATRTGERRV